jgi:hypothetical protein
LTDSSSFFSRRDFVGTLQCNLDFWDPRLIGEIDASGMVGSCELDLMGDDDTRNRADVSSSRVNRSCMMVSPLIPKDAKSRLLFL